MNSRIYQEISSAEIAKIACDLFGNNVKVEKTSLLKGGLFNTTYYVKTTQDETGLVLRVAPINKHLLFSFEKDMMSAEPLFHRLLSENQIPTSNIIKYARAMRVIEREYIVSEYIPSVPMSDPSLENTHLDYIYEKVGALTKQLHAIKSDRFGWKRSDGHGEYDKWSEFIAVYAAEAADKAEEYQLFGKEDVQKFRSLFAESAGVLDEIKTPYMIHTDLWPGNVLLRKKNDAYEVAALIDLDRTIFGDKYWDVASPWMITRDFLRGYNDAIPDDTNHMHRISLYDILGRFFSCYVWLIEYDDPDQFELEKGECLLKLRAL